MMLIISPPPGPHRLLKPKIKLRWVYSWGIIPRRLAIINLVYLQRFWLNDNIENAK